MKGRNPNAAAVSFMTQSSSSYADLIEYSKGGGYLTCAANTGILRLQERVVFFSDLGR